MFHSLKTVLKNIYNKIYSFIHFLSDYKIISFSILYIIFDILTINLLRNINIDIWKWYFLVGIGGGLTLIGILRWLRNICDKISQRKKARKVCRGLLFFLALATYIVITGCICILRNSYTISTEKEIAKQTESFTNKYAQFEGLVATETVNKHTYDTVEVKLTEPINIDGQVLTKENHTMLVKIKKYQKLEIGGVCNIAGMLNAPENFEDFNYKDYLVNNNIYLTMDFPKIECSGERKGFALQNVLVDFKGKLNKIIEENLKEPQSSLLMGIIFGQNRIFSKNFDTNIRIAGVSHIVAASGYNVTILILAGSKLFKIFPYKLRIFLLLLLIWSFCILSGLSPSIVRACIMTSISLLAMFLGRKSSVHIVLPLASCIFTIIDPKIVFNVGFQLSVVATLGLIYLQPTLSHISELIFKKKIEALNNTLFPTLSCTLATFCITIPTFKTISVWAVLANCLVLPVIETTMLLGAIGLLFSRISFLISYFFFQVVNVQLKYFELVVNMIGSAKWGYWELDGVSNIAPIVIGMVLILLCIYFYPVEDETHNYYLKISD